MEVGESPPDPHAGRRERGAGYIPTLDGWRAVAILWVMTHHSRGHLLGASSPPGRALAMIAERGYLGVDIFFGLSGLLITSRLMAERRATGRTNLWAFYARRAFRILPPYFLYVAAVGLLSLLGLLALDRRAYLSCFVFLRNYVPVGDDPSTAHLWSLAVEEHFYFFWPTLFLLSNSLPTARRLALGVASAVMVWRAVDLRWAVAQAVGFVDGWDFRRTDQRLDGLLLGCWMALALSDPASADRARRWLLPSTTLAAAFALGAAAFAVTSRWPALSPLALPKVWSAAVVPPLLASTLLNPASPISRALELAPIRWVGRVSYSLYLWQQLFLVSRPTVGPWLGPLARFPLDWLTTFACAIASHYLIERPCIAAGHRRLRRAAAPVMEGSSAPNRS